MNNELSELVLNCGSWQEAQAITDVLLSKRLVVCVESMEIKSNYHWNGNIDQAKEIKLIMLTKASQFDRIEAEVAKLHSYDTFVLQAIPVTQISKKAKVWLNKETNG